jgi:hypothetical protein
LSARRARIREARARIRGERKTAQDIFFATYQALAGTGYEKRTNPFLAE